MQHFNQREIVYDHVWSLLNRFSVDFPEQGRQIADILSAVHDVPDIGAVIYAEEQYDMQTVIATLRNATNLSSPDKLLLDEALLLLAEINQHVAENKRH